MKIIRNTFWAVACLMATAAAAQDVKHELKATVNDQVAFPETVPPGNYSGITWIGGNVYAVVCDKSRSDGFFIFHIITSPFKCIIY